MNLELSPSTLRAKLEKLARWGVMASALSGILPAELPAEEYAQLYTTVAERIEKLETAKLRLEIGQQVGEEMLKTVENPPHWKPTRAEGVPVPVEGFKKHGVAAAMKKALAAAPQSFTRQIVDVSYDGRMMEMPDVYGMSAKEHRLLASMTREGHRIVFTASSDSYGPTFLSQELRHEICHFGDPAWNTDLGEPDRIRLYAQVLERLSAPNRYRSEYVEDIKNPDPQRLASTKAGEYWAETCGAYLGGDRLLPAADRELVESLLAKTDPAYQRMNPK